MKTTFTLRTNRTAVALFLGYLTASPAFAAEVAKLWKKNPQTGTERLAWNTAAHLIGTCRMDKSASDSVVDSFGRCHEHPYLFIVGSSVFPTGGTANPTLTLAALALRTAQAMRTALAQA